MIDDRRRSIVRGSAVVAATAAAGCLDWLDDESPEDDPEETAEAFVAALAEGDAETVNELMHESATMTWTDEYLGGNASADDVSLSTVDSDPSVETASTHSTVDESVLESVAENAEMTIVEVEIDGSGDHDLVIVLATEDEDWRVLDATFETRGD